MDLARFLRSAGTLALVDFGRRHAERLAAHALPAVRAWSEEVVRAVAALEEAFARARPLTARRRAATERKDAADAGVEHTLRAMSWDLLAPDRLNGDRDAPAYRALFPEGNVRFLQGPIRVQQVQAEAVATHLAAHPEHPAAARLAALRAGLADLERALAEVTHVEHLRRQAETHERERRQALRRTLTRSRDFLRWTLDAAEDVAALFPPVPERSRPRA